MATEICNHLVIGDGADCRIGRPEEIVVVHACKDPCHRNAVGYSGRSLPTGHPNYLYLEDSGNLYLNIIDPPKPLFKIESFRKFIEFLDSHIGRVPVLIHCNEGRSRAPSLALLYAAKRLGLYERGTFGDSKLLLQEKLPSYLPGLGISRFLADHWHDFD